MADPSTRSLVPGDRAEQIDAAYALHLGGASYRKIAERLAVAVSTAHHLVGEALRREPQDNQAAQRRVAHERQRELWQAAVGAIENAPNHRARQDALRTAQLVLKEWRKLGGLDAPDQVEVTESMSPAERQLHDLLDRARVRDKEPPWEMP